MTLAHVLFHDLYIRVSHHHPRVCMCQDFLENLITGYPDLDDTLRRVVEDSVADLPANVHAMFLDAATVMYGRSEQHALCTWEAVSSRPARVRSGLAKLKQRSLLKTDDDGNLWVHDVIKSLAGDKADQDGTRIWRSDQVSADKWLLLLTRETLPICCPVVAVPNTSASACLMDIGDLCATGNSCAICITCALTDMELT